MGLAQHGIRSMQDKLIFARSDIIFMDSIVCNKSGVFEGNVEINANVSITGSLISIGGGSKMEYMNIDYVDLGEDKRTYYTAPPGGIAVLKAWAVVYGTVAVETKLIFYTTTGFPVITLTIPATAVAGDVIGAAPILPLNPDVLKIPQGGKGVIWCDGADTNGTRVTLILECERPGDF